MQMSNTNDMNSRNREIRIKVRLNPTEYATLLKIADAKGTIPAVLFREYIHQNAPK
jgi:hypothetical protein